MANKKPGPVTISSFTYTLDATGNRTQMADLSGTHTYQYDALYRLTQVTYPGPQTDTYTFDAVGNRLTKNATAYTYDNADQMLTAGGVSYGYDSNGNLTSRGTDTFAYDHENRLASTAIGGVGGAYTYNGDGLRLSRNIGGTSVSYTWDVGAGLPVTLQDSQGNTYVYGLDLISRTDSGGNQEYYLYDGLGSTTDLANGAGNTVASYQYDVFGSIRTQSGSSPNEFKFTGEQVDSTGLQYLRARYFDPGIGRFVGQDPLPGSTVNPQTQNRYPYVANNPVNRLDPLGLCGWGDPWNCADDVVDVAVDVAEAVAPYAIQCGIWGVGGAVVGGVWGAVGGCAAGAGALLLGDLVGPNPVTECFAWGGGGFIATRGNYAGAAIGCATGVASYYAPDSPLAQCGVWLAGNFVGAKVVGYLQGAANPHAVRAGVAGCLSAAASASGASTAYAGGAGTTYGGKE